MLAKSNGEALKQSYQAQFGGLNHRKGATDGDIYDMRNMTSDHYPVLSPREKRKHYGGGNKVYGLYCYGDQIYLAMKVGANMGLYVKQGSTYKRLGVLTEGEKQMEVCNMKLIIYPDKVYYDIAKDEFGSMEASLAGVEAEFGSGELYGSVVNNNQIKIAGADLSMFREGDAVTISGCVKVPRNNKTAVIREIHGDRMEFSAEAFATEQEYYSYTNREALDKKRSFPVNHPTGPSTAEEFTMYYGFYHNTQRVLFVLPVDRLAKGHTMEWLVGDTEVRIYAPDATEPTYTVELGDPESEQYAREWTLPFEAVTAQKTYEASITISRVSPDFDHLLAVNNRLWGAKGDTVWGSKLGDPLNWNCFEGISTDSYSVELGSPGDVTGIANYNGYPTFFKEDGIYKLYGAYPSAFQMYATSTNGVKKECGKSIVKIGDALFYVSKNGVMTYAGGIPTPVGEPLGVRLQKGIGGTDGRKYYLSAYDGAEWKLYVYDTYLGLWHIEDNIEAVAMSYGEELVCADANTAIKVLGVTDAPTEGDFDWEVVFADGVVGSPNKKGVQKAILRADCSGGGCCDVYVSFDGNAPIHMGRIENNGKTSHTLPIILNRGDHFRISIKGRGFVDIYGLSYSYYHGSEV